MATQDPNAEPIHFPKPSIFSKLSLFSNKPRMLDDTMPLVVTTEGRVLVKQRKKLLIMKHRNMTEEQVDAYLLGVKSRGDGMNALKGLSALELASVV